MGVGVGVDVGVGVGVGVSCNRVHYHSNLQVFHLCTQDTWQYLPAQLGSSVQEYNIIVAFRVPLLKNQGGE